MNYTRIALSALCAFVVYMAYGGLLFALIPSMKSEFMKYPLIYRSHESIMRVMPLGMVAMFLSIVALAVLYAMMIHTGSPIADGARFGFWIGIFCVGSFVIHNYVNLNIGLRLTAIQAVTYFIQWLMVGIVIGLIYRPPLTR